MIAVPEMIGGAKLTDGNDNIAVFNLQSNLCKFSFSFEHPFP